MTFFGGFPCRVSPDVLTDVCFSFPSQPIGTH